MPAGAVIAGHAYADAEGYVGANPVGRMLRLSAADGAPVWDARFHPTEEQDAYEADHNTECYGVAPAQDGGFVATCSDGGGRRVRRRRLRSSRVAVKGCDR